MQSKNLSKTAKLDAKLRSLFLLSLNGDKVSYRDFLLGVEKMLKQYYAQTFKNIPSEKCEEIVQETLLKIHRYKESYNPEYPITPWIYTIAKNNAYDLLRKHKPNSQMIEENTESQECLDSEYILALKYEISDLLEKVPKLEKELLYLSKVYGFSGKEIAEKKGMSLSAVKVSIHRTIKKLQEKGKSDE